jgi:hypothetical protein
MKTALIAAGAAALYLASVALNPAYRTTWRACVAEEYTADACADETFDTLAACEAFNAAVEYGDEAACFIGE